MLPYPINTSHPVFEWCQLLAVLAPASVSVLESRQACCWVCSALALNCIDLSLTCGVLEGAVQLLTLSKLEHVPTDWHLFNIELVQESTLVSLHAHPLHPVGTYCLHGGPHQTGSNVWWAWCGMGVGAVAGWAHGYKPCNAWRSTTKTPHTNLFEILFVISWLLPDEFLGRHDDHLALHKREKSGPLQLC